MAIDSARVGASIKGRFADVIKSWRIILRLSIAPALAWWISMQVFDTQQAFFAPIAAVLTLTVAAGERVAIVFQIIIGAAFGIMIGELFIMLIGRGAWQLVLIVALAVASARFVRLPPLAVTQAVISGVLLIAIVPVNGIVDPAITRFVDALIGGLVGLAMIILIPANPIRELERGVTSRCCFESGSGHTAAHGFDGRHVGRGHRNGADFAFALGSTCDCGEAGAVARRSRSRRTKHESLGAALSGDAAQERESAGRPGCGVERSSQHCETRSKQR